MMQITTSRTNNTCILTKQLIWFNLISLSLTHSAVAQTMGLTCKTESSDYSHLLITKIRLTEVLLCTTDKQQYKAVPKLGPRMSRHTRLIAAKHYTN